MTDNKYEGWTIGDSTEMDKREHMAEDFYNRILESGERPFFCSDDASFYAIFFGDPKEGKEKILEHYGRTLNDYELSMPFWKLLDLLYTPKPSLPKS
jgi:hypothetical protein